MSYPAKISQITDILARFPLGSVVQLQPSALRFLARAVVLFGRFPLGYELHDRLYADRHRFDPIHEAFTRLSALDQVLLCARLGLSSPPFFRRALAFPGADELEAADRPDAQSVLRLFRTADSMTLVEEMGEASFRLAFETAVHPSLTSLMLFIDRLPVNGLRRSSLRIDLLAGALPVVRDGWDLRVQELLHVFGLLGVDPRNDAVFVTRRSVFRGQPGMLFLYPHPSSSIVTVFAAPDGGPIGLVSAYCGDLESVKSSLAATYHPIIGTRPGELDPRTPDRDRAGFLCSNLEPAGTDVPRNPFRQPEGLFSLLERHLRLREEVNAVLAE